jgi:hypothetical protein
MRNRASSLVPVISDEDILPGGGDELAKAAFHNPNPNSFPLQASHFSMAASQPVLDASHISLGARHHQLTPGDRVATIQTRLCAICIPHGNDR